MLTKTTKALICLPLILLGSAELQKQWKIASKTDHGIQFQWYRPANNSCEVNLRDLELENETSLSATIQYLPHRSAKRAIETETVPLVIRASGSASEHIVGCEEVVGVTVDSVNRK
jgi:hypothetical protein